MKKSVMGLLLMMFVFTTTFVQAGNNDDKYPALEISPDKIKMAIGDTIYVELTYRFNSNTFTDTTAVWTTSADTVVSVDSLGRLIAWSPGESCITATLDTLSTFLCVEVEAPEIEDEEELVEGSLVIIPSDTSIVVGDSLDYRVAFVSEEGSLIDTIASWSVNGMTVGTIVDSTGLFVAEASGFVTVKAQLGSSCVSALLIVGIAEIDGAELNTIVITHDSPHPDGYSVKDSLTEGGMWTIGGLPYPMNVLNGGALYFPVGCLEEDIRINIGLPGFIRGTDSLQYGSNEDVVASVDFQVYVEDTLVTGSYVFETPLITGLIFKRGLLDKMGILPENLALYYAMLESDSIAFDMSGISGTIVDSVSNRIYSQVAHFSTLAITEAMDVTAIEHDKTILISGYKLDANYPNPFNPSTTINFNVPNAGEVSMMIYDLQGRLIKAWTKSASDAGQYSVVWNGRNSFGRKVSSGIYIYRMKAGKFSESRKMLLLK